MMTSSLKTLHRMIWMCAAAQLTIQPALAQRPASAAERAQRLAKLEEDMTSPDASVQIGAFEQAVTAGTAGERSRAYALAFASDDATLREVALRYKICSQTFLNVHYSPNTSRLDDVLVGTTAVGVRDCSPETGTFTTIGPPEGSNRGYRDPLEGPFAKNHILPGGGLISGAVVQLAFRGGTLNVLECSGSFRLVEGKSILAGRMSCRRNSATAPAFAAQIELS